MTQYARRNTHDDGRVAGHERRATIRAVLFDFGETLVTFGRPDTIRLFREGAASSYAFLKQHNQPVGSFALYFWVNMFRIRIKHLVSNITGRDFDTLALLKDVGATKGIDLSPEQWQELAWLWYEPLAKTAKVEPQIKETLTILNRRGLKLGIVSNTFVNRTSLERHLRQLSILDLFAVGLYSYEFSFRKPNVRIFTIAAQRIGEALENILFVGDRIDNDVTPAIKSGMHAVLKDAYTNAGRKYPKGVWRIGRLSELPDLIEKINEGRADSI